MPVLCSKSYQKGLEMTLEPDGIISCTSSRKEAGRMQEEARLMQNGSLCVCNYASVITLLILRVDLLLLIDFFPSMQFAVQFSCFPMLTVANC